MPGEDPQAAVVYGHRERILPFSGEKKNRRTLIRKFIGAWFGNVPTFSNVVVVVVVVVDAVVVAVVVVVIIIIVVVWEFILG